MSKPASNIPFTAKFQLALMELAEQHRDAIDKLNKLIKARKKLEGDMDEMGDSDQVRGSEKYRTTASAWAFVKRSIDKVRGEIEYLAETLVELLLDAKQGKFWADAELEGRLNRKGTETAPLFERAMAAASEAHPNIGESDEDAAKRETAKSDETGKVAAPAAAEEPSAIAVKTWRMLAVAGSLEIGPKSIKALQEAGLMNLGDVERFLHEEKRPLLAIENGFAKADVAKVHTTIDRWRKLEADAAAKAPAPAENGKGTRGRKAVAAAAG